MVTFSKTRHLEIFLTLTFFLTSCGSKQFSHSSNSPPGNPPVCLTICSRREPPQMPNPEGPLSNPNDKNLDGIPYTEGTLALVPQALGVEGSLHYRIFATGLILYRGSITYFGGLATLGGSSLFRQGFQGSYQAKPESVDVKSYVTEGTTMEDYKVKIAVARIAGETTYLTAEAPTEGATASFEVDRRTNPVAIHSGTVTGRVFGIKVSLKVVAKDLEEIIAAK